MRVEPLKDPSCPVAAARIGGGRPQRGADLGRERGGVEDHGRGATGVGKVAQGIVGEPPGGRVLHHPLQAVPEVASRAGDLDGGECNSRLPHLRVAGAGQRAHRARVVRAPVGARLIPAPSAQLLHGRTERAGQIGRGVLAAQSARTSAPRSRPATAAAPRCCRRRPERAVRQGRGQRVAARCARPSDPSPGRPPRQSTRREGCGRCA